MRVKSAEEVAEFLAPVAKSVGVEIIEVKWDLRKEISLTIFLDAPGGVDLNLCEAFHRAADLPLDELDPTFGAEYTLNCSSAGLDRPFRDEKDYARHLGEKIEVRLFAPVGGKKFYEGVLLSYGEKIRLQTEEGTAEIPLEKISKACLFIEI